MLILLKTANERTNKENSNCGIKRINTRTHEHSHSRKQTRTYDIPHFIVIAFIIDTSRMAAAAIDYEGEVHCIDIIKFTI